MARTYVVTKGGAEIRCIWLSLASMSQRAEYQRDRDTAWLARHMRGFCRSEEGAYRAPPGRGAVTASAWMADPLGRNLPPVCPSSSVPQRSADLSGTIATRGYTLFLQSRCGCACGDRSRPSAGHGVDCQRTGQHHAGGSHMRTWLVDSNIAAAAVVVACCLRLLERFTSVRWKRRFGAIGSPLIEPPAYRVLFLLVVIGVVLISMLPEAAFLLPAVDTVGLDIVTIFAALELRHYLASVARLVGIPTSFAVYLRIPAQVMRRGGDVLRTNPVLWLYACMWAVIWLRMLMGRMNAAPPAQL